MLDEFDKSLEIGFEKEMKAIVEALPNVKQRILTSATNEVEMPEFVGLRNELTINYLSDGVAKLEVKVLLSPEKDKLKSLKNALGFLGSQPGIIFCNHKEALERVSGFLQKNQINHQCFHGGMEQKDRERSLIKFRNGTNQLLLATDLAARGLDIPEIKFILHYHLPIHEKEFTHRNGRTARMKRDGIAFILHFKDEELPDFIQEINPERLNIEDHPKMQHVPTMKWKTLYINGGRRDKISKGDIAGLFLKQGQIQKEQLGVIELKQDAAFVAVDATLAEKLAAQLNNSKLKKKKIRISVI